MPGRSGQGASGSREINARAWRTRVEWTAGADARTLVAVSWTEPELRELKPAEQAKRAGALLAERAKAAGVQACVFDRGGYQYHGRVKALAEGAREGGLEF